MLGSSSAKRMIVSLTNTDPPINQAIYVSRMTTSDEMRVEEVLKGVRDLAVEYYKITGKPLGVTGEIGEFEAARRLQLTLSGPREPGYDALRMDGMGPRRVQIKSRRFSGKPNPGARVGSINLQKQWDSVVLVILDEFFLPTEMYEAERSSLEPVLTRPGSKARNVRGQISISQFKAVAELMWTNRPEGRSRG